MQILEPLRVDEVHMVHVLCHQYKELTHLEVDQVLRVQLLSRRRRNQIFQ